MPYDEEVKASLIKADNEAQIWNFNGPEPEIFSKNRSRANKTLKQKLFRSALLSGIDKNEIEAVGFSWTNCSPQSSRISYQRKTRQLGDGQRMANELSIPVVYDFRTNDMTEGGQGVPLCPIYHAALKKIAATSTTAILNLGGLGNLSYYSDKYGLMAFDTGPANAPLNDWIKSFNIGQMDRWRNSSQGKSRRKQTS